MNKKALTFLMTVPLVLFAGRTAFADSFSVALSTSNLGSHPYTPYYGTLTITTPTLNSSTATVTFTTDSGYLMHSDNIVGVNINASSWTISGLTGSNSISGFLGPSLTLSGSGQEDGFGNFNQTFSEFDGYQYALNSLTFTLTDTSGTFADAAAVLIANSLGNIAAAQFGICNTDPCTSSANGGEFISTGYIAPAGSVIPPAVPEPTTLWLLGSAFAAVPVLRRSFFKS